MNAGSHLLPVPLSEIQRVAIFSLAGLGNTILFTPALEHLRKSLPHAEIDFITTRAANFEFLRQCPLVRAHLLEQRGNKAFEDHLRVARGFLNLRRNRYDLSFAIFPSNRIQYHLASLALGARHRLSFRYQWRHRRHLGFLERHDVPVDPALHDVAQNLKLVEAISGLPIDPSQAELRTWTAPIHQKRAEDLLAPIRAVSAGMRIAYHPFSFPDMAFKRWPTAQFVETMNTLSARAEVSHILLGDESERADLERMKRDVSGSCSVICGEEILTAVEVIRRCDLMIANDSGLLHVAAASGIPTVGIFGPTNEGRTRPWGKRCYALISAESRRPCHRYPFAHDEAPHCCREGACLKSISASQLINFLESHGLLG